MEKIAVEPMYFRFIEEDGSLAFIIGPKEALPDMPRLLFDGRDTAVLYRRAGQAVALTKLDAQAAEALGRVKTAHFVEPKKSSEGASLKDAVQAGQIEYEVPVQIVKKLPVSEENLQADPSASAFHGKSAEEIGALIDRVAEIREESV